MRPPGRTSPTPTYQHPPRARAEIDERLRSALRALGPLPVHDGTTRRVLELNDDPEAETGELAAVIERDQSFSANLLRAATAGRRDPSRPVTRIRDALVVVGRDGLRRVALEAATYRLLERATGVGESRATLHAHAVAVAAHAGAIAERADEDPESAHLAGLLHDVGKIVMPMLFPPSHLAAGARRRPDRAGRVAAERDVLGLDHAAVGAALAASWDMEADVVEAIRDHHGPRPRGGLAGCVQAANELVALIGGHDADTALLAGALEALGLPPDTVESVVNATGGGATEEVRAEMRRLEAIARVDDLTGTATRRDWTRRVTALLGDGVAGTLLVVDVDRFKHVNDTHGHPVGDAVLREVGRVLLGAGLAGRLGGDEFAVWVEAPEEDALGVARSVVEAVRRATAGPVPGGVGVSVGLAASGRDGRTLDALLEVADRRLYASKHAGRGRATGGGTTGDDDRRPSPPPLPRTAGPTAGDVVRRVLEAHLPPERVAARAHERGDGERAAEVTMHTLDAMAGDAQVVALILEHCLEPRFLAHAAQTVCLAAVTGCRLGWDDERLAQLVAGALLADIGMTRVRAAIREKPGALTSHERARMELHVEAGGALLDPIAARWPLSPTLARQHHERWDGCGYLRGLRQHQIAEEAGVIAICHRYIAAVTHRPDRPAMTPHDAIELVFTLGGTLADPRLVAAFTASVSAYPIGSYVRLSDGRAGRVAAGGDAIRPCVQVLWGSDGASLSHPLTVHLAEHRTLFVAAAHL